MAWPLAAHPQQPTKPYRIFWVSTGSQPDPFLDGFREGMRVQGYFEGRTSALGTFETAAELGECLLIGVDRKSSAHPQNDLIDPNPTSASDPTGAEHRRCETIHIQIARLELSGCGPV